MSRSVTHVLAHTLAPGQGAQGSFNSTLSARRVAPFPYFSAQNLVIKISKVYGGQKDRSVTTPVHVAYLSVLLVTGTRAISSSDDFE